MTRADWKFLGMLVLIFAAYALVGTIDRQVAEIEAAEHPLPLLDWRIESVADELPDRLEDVRYAELPLRPDR